jgi:hypothetical protein
VIEKRVDDIEEPTRSSKGPFKMVGEAHGYWDRIAHMFVKVGVIGSMVGSQKEE